MLNEDSMFSDFLCHFALGFSGEILERRVWCVCSLTQVFKLVYNKEGSGLPPQPEQEMQHEPIADRDLAQLAEISSYTVTFTSLLLQSDWSNNEIDSVAIVLIGNTKG